MSVATAELRGRMRGSPTLGALRTQLGVAGAQWVSGVGNLAFAVVVARLLAPEAFAELGAFLGAYVLLHLPAAGLGAGTALAPHDIEDRRRRLSFQGLIVGGAIVASTPWTAPVFGVPPALVVALGAAGPSAMLLGLERGRLFGIAQRSRVAASLLAEPTGRLGLGVGAAVLAGSAGGAWAVTVSGYLALAVARGRPGRTTSAPPPAAARSGRATTTATFVLFALLQQQDLLVAKARLGAEAGQFAALSTAGGAVAFATATIPLAVLPAATRNRRTDRVAITLTVAIGLVAVTATAVAGPGLLGALFGPGYDGAAWLLAPYMGAMALLGLGRVLAASRCARGQQTRVVGAVGFAFVVHALGLGLAGTSIAGVVGATTAATAIGAGTLALPAGGLRGLAGRARDAMAQWARTGDLVLVTVLTAGAAGLRLVSTRGLWIDEAITVSQAQMPFGAMLDQLRATDVHPPLHHAVVWVLVRLGGTAELVVRAPSIIAGALLVPAVFGLANGLYGRRTGLVAAAFAAVAPFAVWYSQEARMYALFMLFATLALWAQVSALRGGGRWAWAAYAASTAAMLWTQWFAVVPIAAQQLVFLGALVRRRHDRAERRRLATGWAVTLAATLVLVLPLVPIALDQLEAYTGRRAGQLAPATSSQAGTSASGLAGDVSVYTVGANALWAVVGYHSDSVMTQLAALWPLLLLAAFATLGRGRSDRTTALLACIAVPTVAFVAAGAFKRDLFELRYFASVVPLLLVLLSRGVTATVRRPVAQTAAAVVAASLLLVGLVDQQLNGANPRRYDFEGALEQVVAESDPDDVVLYEPDYLAEVIDYYAPGVEARPLDERDRLDPDGTAWVLATTRVADDEATSARVGDALADLEQGGRTITDEITVPNVRVWELR